MYKKRKFRKVNDMGSGLATPQSDIFNSYYMTSDSSRNSNMETNAHLSVQNTDLHKNLPTNCFTERTF